MNKQQNRRGLKRLLVVQIGTILIFALLCLLVFGVNASSSAVLGGVVCIVPNAYFASRIFKYQGARAAKQIVNSFYKGEALKIIMSMFLFTAVFISFRITPLAFFGGYIAVQITHWFAPWLIVHKQNRPESD